MQHQVILHYTDIKHNCARWLCYVANIKNKFAFISWWVFFAVTFDGWVMTFLFTIANLVKMNLQICKLHVCTTLTNFSMIQFGFQESCYMLVTSWNGFSTHGDFRLEIPQNLVTLAHSFPRKSFAWIALDFYFFGCQVGKICPSVSLVVTCSLVTMLTSFCFGVKCFWKGLVLQTSILLHPHPL